MNILEFGKIMAKEVGDVLGEKVNVDFKEILKNNGVTYHALVIKKEDENIAPTIYLDDLFERYQKGKVLMGIVNDIVRVYKEYEPSGKFDVSFFTDFSNVADKLSFKVINYYKNMELLSGVPYIRFADLALVPICMIKDKNLGSGTITIRNEHLKEWEVGKEELWENVYKNADKVAPVKVKNIMEYLSLREDIFDGIPFPKAYVLSNSNGSLGASAFLYPGVMKKLSQRLNSNLVIIPSSIHETIVLSYDDISMGTQTLFDMVREVNTTVIANGEVLSDNVYFYNMETDKMGILGK